MVPRQLRTAWADDDATSDGGSESIVNPFDGIGNTLPDGHPYTNFLAFGGTKMAEPQGFPERALAQFKESNGEIDDPPPIENGKPFSVAPYASRKHVVIGVWREEEDVSGIPKCRLVRIYHLAYAGQNGPPYCIRTETLINPSNLRPLLEFTLPLHVAEDTLHQWALGSCPLQTYHLFAGDCAAYAAAFMQKAFRYMHLNAPGSTKSVEERLAAAHRDAHCALRRIRVEEGIMGKTEGFSRENKVAGYTGESSMDPSGALRRSFGK